MNAYVVLNSAAEGRDAELNDWYTGVHFPELLDRQASLRSASRWRLIDPPPMMPGARYMSLLTFDGESADDFKGNLARNWTQMTRTDAAAPGSTSFMMDLIGEIRRSGNI